MHRFLLAMTLFLAACPDDDGEPIVDAAPANDCGGCSPDSGPDADLTDARIDVEVTPVTLPVEELGAAQITALCEKAYACCTPREVSSVPGLPPGEYDSAATCSSTGVPFYELVYAPVVEQVAAGRLTYDGVAARACIDGILAASCDVFNGPTQGFGAVCATIARGTDAIGAACQDGTCVPGAFCGSEGLCVALPTEGQACPDFACAEGLLCDETCVKLRADGEACEDDYDCASTFCNEQMTCAPFPEATTCDGL